MPTTARRPAPPAGRASGPRAVLFAAALLLAVAACGQSATSTDTATIVLDLEFPTDSTTPPITHVRILILDATTGAVLVTHDLTVAEGASGRMIALSIEENLERPIVLEVTLRASADGENLWIGRSEPMSLQRGDDPRPAIVFVRATREAGRT
ncbi:MAG TPA: hypothetical protein VK928_04985 [Longimicrobiales bacterium]|nr:hypothetical protein [Longimicrobiales bacterium]